VIGSKVPIADSHDFEDLTFMVTCWKAKAAVQIAVSTSLSWPAPVQRERSFNSSVQ
jgi:siroheme synthase (precorrin-2 oxidase/ferrochelatase)